MKTATKLAIPLGVATALTACAMLYTYAAAPPAPPTSPSSKGAHKMPSGADNFYKSDKVTAQKVSFKNQYQMTVAGNLFLPKGLDKDSKHPAVVVGHPMGAVKEQSADLYATKMAEQGFVAMSVDLSFWGESDGQPRNAVAPDIYAETFSAAVDYLGTRPFVDRKRVGAIGICGSGSFVISAAKLDPRIRAVATVSMYDMGAASRHALEKSLTSEQRKKMLEEAAEQRYAEFEGGKTRYTGGTVHELTEDTHPIQREFYDFYRTPRPLLLWLRLEDDGSVDREVRFARVEALKAAVVATSASSDEGAIPVRDRYELQLARAEADVARAATGANGETVDDLVTDANNRDVEVAVVRAATVAQRQRLVALRADGTIGDAAFQRVEEELDWVELGWARLLAAGQAEPKKGAQGKVSG